VYHHHDPLFCFSCIFFAVKPFHNGHFGDRGSGFCGENAVSGGSTKSILKLVIKTLLLVNASCQIYCSLSCCLCSLLFQDNISDSTLKKLKKYIDNPKFTPENVEKVSKVCSLTVFCGSTEEFVCFTLDGKCLWYFMLVYLFALDEFCT